MSEPIFEFVYDRDSILLTGNISIYDDQDVLIKSLNKNSPGVNVYYTFPVGELTFDPLTFTITVDYSTQIEANSGNLRILTDTNALVKIINVTGIVFS